MIVTTNVSVLTWLDLKQVQFICMVSNVSALYEQFHATVFSVERKQDKISFKKQVPAVLYRSLP